VSATETVTTAVPETTSRRWKLFVLVLLFTLVADQASKVWARHSLPVEVANRTHMTCVIPDDIVDRDCVGTAVSFIDGVWEWRLSFNPGSAFGLFHSADGARWFLSIIGVLAVFGMIWMVKKAREDQKALIWALGLVAGGAIGNLIDRIYFGVVTDFVLWHWKDKEWPVFNVADVALVIGVALMFLDIQKEGRAEKARARAAASAKRQANGSGRRPARTAGR
jgi:signal peptidase II